MRAREERTADVRRLLDAARSIVEGRARYLEALVASTGLSPPGVELALTRHLEVDADDRDLDALVARAGDAPAVHVILSANVLVAPLRAIAIARAAAPRVTVRPSTRDPVLARALIERAGDPAIALSSAAPEAIARGEIHVYGRDATIAAVCAAARPGVIVRGHGAGAGVAVVSRSADLEHAAARLAEDVIPFDQRGCLSPRAAIVIGGEARALSFGRALARSLESFETAVPRGVLSDDERAEAARYAATIEFAGTLFRAPAALVGVARELLLAPSGRHLHVAFAADVAAAAAMLAPLARYIVAIGSDDLRLAQALGVPHARASALGRMQRPALDGPVDMR